MNAPLGGNIPPLSDTRFWTVSEGYSGMGDSVRKWFGTDNLSIVSDTVIWNRLGEPLRRAIAKEGLTVKTVELLPGEPVLHAEYDWIRHLTSKLRASDSALVSFGSGTVNDLVKRSAFELEKPYLSVATAPSVDGYSSYGAAILVDGFKKTLECNAPRVIYADPDVLSSCPAELLAAGYGDLASKLTTGSDWLLADAFGIEAIEPVAWSIVQDDLRERLEAPPEKRAEILFVGLLKTGFAMQHMRSSRPVSGCEHLVAHIWEMENLELNGRPVLHGNKVALGLLTATAFTEEIRRKLKGMNYRLKPGFAEALPDREKRADEVGKLSAHLPPAAAEELVEVSLEKLPSKETVKARYSVSADSLESAFERAGRHLLPLELLERNLEAAGCPTRASSLGIDRNRFVRTIRLAQAMRNRFTVLDAAWELGVFEECLENTVERVYG